MLHQLTPFIIRCILVSQGALDIRDRKLYLPRADRQHCGELYKLLALPHIFRVKIP